MEVRCGKCNKLFRVSDDKITGSGVKFKCTKCTEYVTITRESFEHYRLAASTAVPEQVPTPPAMVTATAEQEAQKHSPAVPPVDLQPPEPREPLGVSGHEKTPGAEQPSPAPPEKQESPVSQGPKGEPTGHPAPSEPSTGSPVTAPVVHQISRPVSQIGIISSDMLKPLQADVTDTVNAFATGAAAGTIGGIACALPVIGIMLLGINPLSSFIAQHAPQLSSALSLSPIYNAAMIAAGMTGLGIVIGIVLAAIQAGTEKRIFSFPGIVIALFLGALIGAGKGVIVSAGSGSYISMNVVLEETITWAVESFLISIAIVLVRRLMMSEKRESFSARLSVVQIIGLVLSVAIIGLAAYGEVQSATALRTATTGAVDTSKNVISAEGLQITNNPSGYIDSNGDLVITGVVENTTDQEKPIWLLVADVFDAQGAVIVEAKVLSGKQLYTSRDYDILAKRGVNVEELKAKRSQEKGTSLPPHGMANFEIRIMEPPIGIATFNTLLKQFDPMLFIKEYSEMTKSNQQ